MSNYCYSPGLIMLEEKTPEDSSTDWYEEEEYKGKYKTVLYVINGAWAANILDDHTAQCDRYPELTFKYIKLTKEHSLIIGKCSDYNDMLKKAEMLVNEKDAYLKPLEWIENEG